METVYFILGLLTAGVSLGVSTVSLLVGLKRDHKTNLIFAVMGFSLAIFVLLPPVGFIFADHAPYPAIIIVKRTFIFLYYALMPWFVFSYSRHPRKIIPAIITLLVFVCFLAMATTPTDNPQPVWPLLALLGFGSILLYGILAAAWHSRKVSKKNGRWLLAAIFVYGFLFLLTAAHQLNNFFHLGLPLKLFLPMHAHSLLFMLIMGLQLVSDILEKDKLEKLLQVREKRWQSFMENAPVIVVELDRSGCVTYINDFGVKLMGYACPDQIHGQNWFDHFTPAQEARKMKSAFDKAIKDGHSIPYFKSTVRTRQGNEITIDWVNFIIQRNDGKAIGSMSIGRDVTQAEADHLLVDQLKLELQKEVIVPFQEESWNSGAIIGVSKAVEYAVQKARQVAATHAPVLIEGETGVGKELLADLVHELSSRSKMPMIKINCGALPKDLIEDELFGHEKGAFTSAIQARKGRFELADGGTIFLDEVGELPLEMQPKLLRVLQSGEFERIGGQQTIKCDVRVIAATNRDLAQEVQRGRFRDDLFYRLDVFPITIPPLRKRKEDLELLINYFITRKSQEYGKSLDQISKADLQRLMDYDWPGNIRELKNVIERSVIVSQGSTLKLDWFFPQPGSPSPAESTALEEIEKEHILKTLEKCGWKINGENGAAERLNLHPNTLRSKMKKLDINRPSKSSSVDTMG